MDDALPRKAILELDGARCTSCAIAIEHAGRRLPGIQEIYVNRAASTVEVTYTGQSSVLDRICDVVRRIGYEATVRTAG